MSSPAEGTARFQPTPTVGRVEGIKSFSGAALRRARITAGLSHDTLGLRIGRRQLIHWEQGRLPTPAALVLLAQALNLDPFELLDVTEETPPSRTCGAGPDWPPSTMEAEVTDRVGPKHAKIPDRTASRHASAPGSVVLGARRVPISRPRARTVDGTEVELETYATFAADDLLTKVVLERMLAGVAIRRHRAVAEPVGRAVTDTAGSTSASLVSRRFKAATAVALEELMGRDLSELAVVAR